MTNQRAEDDVRQAAQSLLESLRILTVQIQSEKYPTSQAVVFAFEQASNCYMAIHGLNHQDWLERGSPIEHTTPKVVQQLYDVVKPILAKLYGIMTYGFSLSTDTDLMYLGTQVLVTTQNLLGAPELPGYTGPP